VFDGRARFLVIFLVNNGTRQGGVLFPYLFSRYVRDLLHGLVSTRIGCNLGGRFINVLAYADDFVLIAPFWHALQQLLNILSTQIGLIDMSCNGQKTMNDTALWLYYTKSRARLVRDVFPPLKI